MNKALFLDRDGVINVDHGYVYKQQDIEFVDGIFELVKRFRDAGYLIIVVTNQSGIARGYYSEDDFWQLTHWMQEQFRQQQCNLDYVYFCPHYIDGTVARYQIQCDCRKPNPGMLQKAAKEHDLDLSRSLMVGDKKSDMLAAKAAGVNKCFYFSSQPVVMSDELKDVKLITKLSQITV